MKRITTNLTILLISFFSLTSAVSAQTVPIPIGEELDKVGVQFDLGHIVSAVLSIAMPLGLIALLLYFVISAYKWLTAGGDKTKVEEAKSGITNGIIGLAILASVFAIYAIVDQFFGIGLTEQQQQYSYTLCPAPGCVCGNVNQCVGACTAGGKCITSD